MKMTEKEKLIRDITTIRESINRDWADLSSLSSLSHDERTAIRTHIEQCIQELKGLIERLSYAGIWVTRRSGGVVCRHFDDLDAILESDTSDNLRQLIFTLQPPPGLRGGDDQLEYHQLGGRGR